MKPKNILVFLIIFSLFIGSVFAAATAEIITFPAGGEVVGHTLSTDFNFSDDQNIPYSQKGIIINLAISGVNVLSDFNSSDGISTGACEISGQEDSNVGTVRCQIAVNLSVREIGDGTHTLDVNVNHLSDGASDTNSSASFEVIKSYRIIDDVDVNSFTSADYQDLTEAGIGTTFQNVVVFMGLIVLAIVITAIGAIIISNKRKIKSQ